MNFDIGRSFLHALKSVLNLKRRNSLNMDFSTFFGIVRPFLAIVVNSFKDIKCGKLINGS